MNNVNVNAEYNAAYNKLVDVVNTELHRQCADGKFVTRAAACESMGLKTDHQLLISFLIKDGKLPDFKVNVGINGGIGLATAVNQKKQLDQNFVTRVKDALEACVPEKSDKGISRAVIAQYLGEPGSKMENEISKVLSIDDLKFHSRKGPRGGIFRGSKPPKKGAIVAQTPTSQPMVTLEASEEVTENVSEPVEVAEVVAVTSTEPTVEVQQPGPQVLVKVKRNRKKTDTAVV